MNCPHDGLPCTTERLATGGVRCPGCGALRLRVIDTSHSARGIIRLRRCVVCGRRLQTVEFVWKTDLRGQGSVRGRYPPLPKG